MLPVATLAGESPPRPAGPGPLRTNRNFGYFLGGNTASWAGLGAADVLVIWLVFSDTGATLAVAAVGLMATIPPVALGYFAGALADRHSRRSLLVLTGAAQAATLGLIPVSIALVGFQLWVVLALMLGLETATVVFGLAATAILPGLVDSEGLDGANGLTQAFSSVAWAVGASAAAVLLVVAGTSPSFGVNFVLFAVGALLVGLVAGPAAPSTTSAASATGRGFRNEFVEGVRFLRDHAWLLRFTIVAVATGFFVTMYSPYLVVFAVDGLDLPASYFGYLAAAYSAGFFTGSLLTARFRIVGFFGRFLGLAVLASGGMLGLLVLVPGFGIALVELAGMGVLMGLVITGSITLVQRAVPAEMLGRYLGLQETMVWFVAPFGVVTGGILIDVAGVREGFGVAAVGLVAVGLVTFSSARFRSIAYTSGAVPESGVPGG